MPLLALRGLYKGTPTLKQENKSLGRNDPRSTKQKTLLGGSWVLRPPIISLHLSFYLEDVGDLAGAYKHRSNWGDTNPEQPEVTPKPPKP